MNRPSGTSVKYYEYLAQCLKCGKMYPISSTNSVTLCIACLDDEDAQHYKVEKEEQELQD